MICVIGALRKIENTQQAKKEKNEKKNGEKTFSFFILIKHVIRCGRFHQNYFTIDIQRKTLKAPIHLLLFYELSSLPDFRDFKQCCGFNQKHTLDAH